MIEKVLEMVYRLIKEPDEEIKDHEGSSEQGYIKQMQEEVKESKIDIFRKKVRAVGKMMTMFKTLREEEETILQLKGLCPDNKVPRGLLQ